MANIKRWLPPFDPAAEYVWRRPVKIDGKAMRIGKAVRRDQFTTRALRRLFEQRMIVRTDGVGAPRGWDALRSVVRPPAPWDEPAPEDGAQPPTGASAEDGAATEPPTGDTLTSGDPGPVPGAYGMKHVGHGRYKLTHAGEPFGDSMDKATAKAVLVAKAPRAVAA